MFSLFTVEIFPCVKFCETNFHSLTQLYILYEHFSTTIYNWSEPQAIASTATYNYRMLNLASFLYLHRAGLGMMLINLHVQTLGLSEIPSTLDIYTGIAIILGIQDCKHWSVSLQLLVEGNIYMASLKRM